VIAGLLGFPIIGTIVKAGADALLGGYRAKLDAGNTSERIAADLAQRELDVQKREIEVRGENRRAMIGHWWEPEQLCAYIFVMYLGKVVVWDTMLGLGSTLPIKGSVGEWMAMIAIALFGKRGIENVAVIMKGRTK
jgi:small basic protein